VREGRFVGERAGGGTVYNLIKTARTDKDALYKNIR